MLRRTASYPDSHILTFALLIIALITESMLNGVFFAEGSDAGLIGGVATALVISFFNISVGFVTGFLVTRIGGYTIKDWQWWVYVVTVGIIAVTIIE